MHQVETFLEIFLETIFYNGLDYLFDFLLCKCAFNITIVSYYEDWRIKENKPNEKRVALTPSAVTKIKKLGYEISIERTQEHYLIFLI